MHSNTLSCNRGPFVRPSFPQRGKWWQWRSMESSPIQWMAIWPNCPKLPQTICTRIEASEGATEGQSAARHIPWTFPLNNGSASKQYIVLFFNGSTYYRIYTIKPIHVLGLLDSSTYLLAIIWITVDIVGWKWQQSTALLRKNDGESNTMQNSPQEWVLFGQCWENIGGQQWGIGSHFFFSS